MVEALGQTLGALGRLVLQAGGHRAGDGQELGLDAAPDAAAPALELGLQAGDRPLQARHWVALTCLPPVRKLDDLTHDAIVEPPSDISSEPAARWDSTDHVWRYRFAYSAAPRKCSDMYGSSPITQES